MFIMSIAHLFIVALQIKIEAFHVAHLGCVNSMQEFDLAYLLEILNRKCKKSLKKCLHGIE